MKNLGLNHIILVFYVFLFILFVACSPAIIAVGAGLGLGAAAYSSGEMSKIYPAEYHRAVDASVDTLNELKIPPTEIISDELKTEILAERPNGTNITLDVERIDPQNTEISIRTGTIGVQDKRVSKQIHDYIKQRLNSTSTNLYKNDFEPKNKTLASEPIKKELGDLGINKKESKPISSKVTVPDNKSSLTNKIDNKIESKEIVILFQQDSNILQEKAFEKLDKIATLLHENPEATITITGFPDPGGSLAYKQMLSDSRAKTIKYYFIGKGINSVRAKTVVSSSIGKITNQGAEIKVVSNGDD